MKNKKEFIVLVILTLSGLLYVGCYSDQYEPEPVIIDPVETISFTNDIVPLFVSGCNQSICHGVGAAPPDLTPANAYNSMINGGYVNTSDPVASEFYLSLIGDGGRDIMPPSGKDDELITLILGWMQQGAINN